MLAHDQFVPNCAKSQGGFHVKEYLGTPEKTCHIILNFEKTYNFKGMCKNIFLIVHTR